MAVNLIVNGVTYVYPELSDEGWGPDTTNWAVAITQGVLTKAGGLFVLTADVDFGPNFGLKSVVYKTRSSNLASTGQFRLSNSDTIVFRNSTNASNLAFGAGSVDAIPSWNGVDLVNISSAQTISNKTFTGSTFTGDTFTNPTIINPTVTTGTFSNPSVTSGTFTNPSVSAGTFTSPNLGNPVISGIALFADGTAAAPSISFSNASTTGFYKFATNSLGIASNGISAGNINASQAWTIGAASSTQTHSVLGNAIMGTPGSGSEFVIGVGASNTGELALTGSGSSSNGGVILLYGNSHVSQANVIQFNNAGSISGSISASHLWTIGASGGTQTHVINGSLSVVNASGLNVDSLTSISLTDNTTNGVAITNATATSTNWVVDYSLTRSATRETGTLLVVSDGSTAQVSTQSIGIGDSGVSFTADVSGGNVRLLYTTTSTGSAVTMKYSTKRWNS